MDVLGSGFLFFQHRLLYSRGKRKVAENALRVNEWFVDE